MALLLHQHRWPITLPQLSAALAHGDQLLGPLGPEKRICLGLDEISPWLVQAVIGIEDRRFYRHRGVDPIGIGRAILANLRRGRLVQGGSTITQQLARSSVLHDQRRTIRRKLVEIFVAILLERRFAKAQILETYLNAAYFGHGIFGVEVASRHYLGKPARSVNWVEAVYLAGLLSSPARYCACCNPVRAVQRLAFLLNHLPKPPVARRTDSMGYSRVKTRKTLVDLMPRTSPYFLSAVAKQLTGLGVGFPDRRLVVRTTLVPEVQATIEKACQEQEAIDPDSRVACLVLGGRDGKVLGIAGGLDCRRSPFNAALSGSLQPGSLIKPFLALCALRVGGSLEEEYNSTPLSIDLPNAPTWRVRNYRDHYRGRITLSEALIHSDNTVFAQLVLKVGPSILAEFLSTCGLSVRAAVPSLVLGALRPGCSPLQIATAFSVFSARGSLYRSTFIEEVADEEGRLVYRWDEPRDQIASSEFVEEIRRVLRDAARRGTAQTSLKAAIHAKTGTSISGSWFASFDDAFRVITWSERQDDTDDGVSAYPEKGVTAKALAERIWNLLKKSSLASPALYGAFRGTTRLDVRDLLWLEQEFQIQ